WWACDQSAASTASQGRSRRKHSALIAPKPRLTGQRLERSGAAKCRGQNHSAIPSRVSRARNDPRRSMEVCELGVYRPENREADQNTPAASMFNRFKIASVAVAKAKPLSLSASLAVIEY